MAETQDNVMKALDEFESMFDEMDQNGLPFEILQDGLLKDMYGLKLAREFAGAFMVASVMGSTKVMRKQRVFLELNQNVDGYRIDKAIEAEKASNTMITENGGKQ